MFKVKGGCEIKEFIFIILILLIFGIAVAIETTENINNFTGTYIDTIINSTGNNLFLNYTNSTNSSYVLSGNYTSNVIEYNFPQAWNNISFYWEKGDVKEVGSSETGLLLLMHFNNNSIYGENDTYIFDFAGGDNNGTTKGGAPWWNSSGYIGGTFEFDGNDNITLSSTFPLKSTGFTIAFWGREYSGSTASHFAIESRTATAIFYVGRRDTNRVYFYSISAGISASIDPSITWSNWNHFAFVLENNTIARAYVNGAEKVSDSSVTSLSANPTLMIGVGASAFWNGSIDELVIYNTNLSGTEVSNLYQRGMGNLTNVKIQVRSDNDNASWSDFIGPDGTNSSYFTNSTNNNLSNLSYGKYFQYKLHLSTLWGVETPRLYNITINSQNVSSINISLVSPNDNQTWTSINYSTFIYNVTGGGETIQNCSLYRDDELRITSTSITKNTNLGFYHFLTNGNYNWSVKCYDNLGLSGGGHQ